MSGRRDRAYLEAMGIEAWVRRDASFEAPPEPAGEVAPLEEATPAPAGPELVSPPAADGAGDSSAPATRTMEAEPAAAGGESPAVERLDWDALAARVAGCTACELHQGRTQTVFGVGARQAQWMIIGEAPGAEEDRQGEPFVGRAGQLLNNMLLAVGLKREQVYIANILKCRPPNNRDPRPEEVACCEPYLARQVALLQPRIVLAVGRIAAQNLLKTDSSLARLRGQVFHYGEAQVPVVVTYHPAYLLRSPREKRKAWEDLQFAMRLYAQGQGA